MKMMEMILLLLHPCKKESIIWKN